MVLPATVQSFAFELPSHAVVGPTTSDPSCSAVAFRPVSVRGLPLPLREDFADAFAGRQFVRFPVRRGPSLHGAAACTARLPIEPPAIRDSLWLPDHCVITSNMLDIVRHQRPLMISSTVNRGVAKGSIVQ